MISKNSIIFAVFHIIVSNFKDFKNNHTFLIVSKKTIRVYQPLLDLEKFEFLQIT